MITANFNYGTLIFIVPGQGGPNSFTTSRIIAQEFLMIEIFILLVQALGELLEIIQPLLPESPI
jgi:hypothetical protein